MLDFFTKRAQKKRLANLPDRIRIDNINRPAMTRRMKADGYSDEQVAKFFEVVDEMITEANRRSDVRLSR